MNLYSVSALSDSSGAVVERYGYDAYGKRIILDGAGTTVRTASSFGNNIGFTGREWDEETGLWYFRARMYSDRLGRFVSRDPMGYVDGYNKYNPYYIPNKLDWSGEQTTCGTFSYGQNNTTSGVPLMGNSHNANSYKLTFTMAASAPASCKCDDATKIRFKIDSKRWETSDNGRTWSSTSGGASLPNASTNLLTYTAIYFMFHTPTDGSIDTAQERKVSFMACAYCDCVGQEVCLGCFSAVMKVNGTQLPAAHSSAVSGATRTVAGEEYQLSPKGQPCSSPIAPNYPERSTASGTRGGNTEIPIPSTSEHAACRSRYARMGATEPWDTWHQRNCVQSQ